MLKKRKSNRHWERQKGTEYLDRDLINRRNSFFSMKALAFGLQSPLKFEICVFKNPITL